MDNMANKNISLRIATYSQDGLGLGHMRRTHLIASQLLKACPEASVLTLSDSQLGQFFTPAPNHDYLKLPSIVKDGPGQWRAANLAVPFNEVSALRQDLIRQAVLSFRPHVLLVDHMPHGAMGELVPTLEALRNSGLGTKIVLGLRDILDAPQVVQSRWQVEGAYAAIERYYDRVLIYGMHEVFDLAEQYRFSPQLAERLRYCGYVGAPAANRPNPCGRLPRPVTALRKKFLKGPNACAKLVVAMAGGGADAYPMMSTLLDALSMMQQRQRTFLVLVTGPFMPVEQREDLQSRAQGLPVRVITSIEDSNLFLQAADLVVAMAGYNTTVEILQTGKRAILIPRRGPSAEQRTRVRLFAERGWIDMIDPDDLSVEFVAQMVSKNLALGPYMLAHTRPNLEGVHVAAEALIDLLPGATVPVSQPDLRRSMAYELA